MKKIFLTALLIFLVPSLSYGAVSEDMSVYVRQDVFDAKMEALFLRLHNEIENLGNRIDGNIKALSERIDGNYKELLCRIDGNYATLSERTEGNYKDLSNRIDVNYRDLSNRIDGLEKRVGDVHSFLYGLLVLFGALLLLSFVNRWWERHEEKMHAVTLEDVRRLIEENNAQLIARLRA